MILFHMQRLLYPFSYLFCRLVKVYTNFLILSTGKDHFSGDFFFSIQIPVQRFIFVGIIAILFLVCECWNKHLLCSSIDKRLGKPIQNDSAESIRCLPVFAVRQWLPTVENSSIISAFSKNIRWTLKLLLQSVLFGKPILQRRTMH